MFLLKVLKGLLFLDGVRSREAKFFVLQQKKDDKGKGKGNFLGMEAGL